MKSEGNLGSDALAEAHDAWWSVTAWDDRAHMEAYVNTDPISAPKLSWTISATKRHSSTGNKTPFNSRIGKPVGDD